MAEVIAFDIVLKLAERCNLACSYCYYFYTDFKYSSTPPLVQREVIERLPAFIRDAVQTTSLNRINIVFHGGEPLLLKKSYFDEICTYLARELDGVVDLHFSMQSNGVLIDEEWIALFAKHNVGVGISIDGMKEDHDRNRPDKKGRGSYDAAVAGLRLMQQAETNGTAKKAGVLGCVPKDSSNSAFLRHLIEDLKIESPGLNFPRGGWSNADAVAWNANTENRRELVRTWLDEYLFPRFRYIIQFAEILFAMMSDEGAEWLDRRYSRRHHIMTISSNGDILPDDNLIGNREAPDGRNMNVFDNSFLDFIGSSVWQELQTAVDNPPDTCRDCEWYRVCRGGALYNRFDPDSGYTRQSVLCDTVKVICEEISEYVVRLNRVDVDQLIARLQAPPTCSGSSMLDALTGTAAPEMSDKARMEVLR